MGRILFSMMLLAGCGIAQAADKCYAYGRIEAHMLDAKKGDNPEVAVYSDVIEVGCDATGATMQQAMLAFAKASEAKFQYRDSDVNTVRIKGGMYENDKAHATKLRAESVKEDEGKKAVWRKVVQLKGTWFGK